MFFQFDKRATFAGRNQIQTSTVNPAAAAERLCAGGGRSAGILALTSPRRRVDGLCAAAPGSGDAWQGAHAQEETVHAKEEFTIFSATHSRFKHFMLAACFSSIADSDIYEAFFLFWFN